MILPNSIPSEVIYLKEVQQSAVEAVSRELNVPPTIARILACRRITDPAVMHWFFNPSVDHFHDPFRFEQMQRSVDRIRQAIAAKEMVVIHGDYDVDGVTATVLMIRVLRHFGCVCDYFLPNRITQGYGMSRDGIDTIAARKAGLIITVDCGITSEAEIGYARSKGIDVIVTDHHEAQGALPAAFSVLNPKVPGCSYPDKDLAGVGVALKLCQALVRSLGAPAAVWQELLDIVSLGTAADIVPLLGENRIIARLGFQQLSVTKNVGLQKLIEQQNLTGKTLSTQDVVYCISPCINAAGRLGDALCGVKMLLTNDPVEADLLARELVALNTQRRALDKQVQDTAEAWVRRNADLTRDYAIVAGDCHWHVGVIGIAASRLVEKFCRPVFLFSISGEEIGRGSGRSIPGVHLLDALRECHDLLDSFGGHEAAAGAHIQVKNIEPFRKRFNEAIRAQVRFEELVPKVFADAEVSVADLTPQFFALLSSMEPFGPGNGRPLLVCRNLRNSSVPRVVGAKHLKMMVQDGERTMDAIAFNFGNRYNQVSKAQKFSMAFYLDENVWNGRTSLQMRVKGIMT